MARANDKENKLMLSGRDSLALFNQRINDSRSQINGIHRHLEKISKRLAEIRQEKAVQYRELARVRLDDIAAGKLIDGLDGTDRAVLRLLAQKAEALNELNNQIDTSLNQQKILDDQRNIREKQRDETLETVEEKVAETSAQLETVIAYQQQKENWQTAITQAQNAEEKAKLAKTDRVEKGKPYENDPLFMYLWRRRYLTPDYEGGWLTRSLDGWVAKLINFEDARPNYFMLTELPVRLRAHADSLKQKVENENNALATLEAEAAEKNGVVELRTTLSVAEKNLHKIDDEIEAEENRHAKLLHNRASFAADEDEFSRQAIELQVGQLKKKTLSDLYRAAQATPNPKDDVLVNRLGGLTDEEQRLYAEIETLKSTERHHQNSLTEMEKLRQWFRRQNYDSQYSGFPAGFGLGILLDQLLRGGISTDRIRDRIRHEQQFKLPRTRRGRGRGIDFGGFWWRQWWIWWRIRWWFRIRRRFRGRRLPDRRGVLGN